MAALPFNDSRIEDLVLRFNAVMAKEGTNISDLGGNAKPEFFSYQKVLECPH